MTRPITLVELDEAAALVHRHVPPTPQFSWPILNEELGCEVWVKHENHTPLGAFKVRGGVVYFDRLSAREPDCAGVIAATRGNHGQSIAFAARARGLSATVVVPRGNSSEKNAAMRALGARLIEHGRDFQEALEHARELAARDGLHLVPPVHRDLILGVASYSLELLRAQPNLDTLYVPIGMGSGICAAIAVRDALGLATEIVGVVSAAAPAYALAFAAGEPREAPVGDSIADGLACRQVDAGALDTIIAGAARIVTVSEDDLCAAMRLMFRATHNACEGAGAAALAALLQERTEMAGRHVGIVLTGGNIDSDRFGAVIAAAD